MWPLSKEGTGAAWKRELLQAPLRSLRCPRPSPSPSLRASPIVGLQAAWINGLFASAFGDRPGMVTGATGALAVVLPDLIKDEGLEYLFRAVFFSLIQILCGLLNFGRFI